MNRQDTLHNSHELPPGPTQHDVQALAQLDIDHVAEALLLATLLGHEEWMQVLTAELNARMDAQLQPPPECPTPNSQSPDCALCPHYRPADEDLN